jgi:hypothetical protein
MCLMWPYIGLHEAEVRFYRFRKSVLSCNILARFQRSKALIPYRFLDVIYRVFQEE